jgi:hypothetical protein
MRRTPRKSQAYAISEQTAEKRIERIKGRSAVSNGVKIVSQIDGRSGLGRRYRDVQRQVAADLGDDLSHLQLHLTRSVAGLVVLREIMDRKILDKQYVAIADYSTLVNCLNRTSKILGLSRVPRAIDSRSLHEQLIDVEAT